MAVTRDKYMQQALDEARKSPPQSTNYCVGALLVDVERDLVLSTGYTLELPGNTHAEQCCLQKIIDSHDSPEQDVRNCLPANTAIYTTMEPCVFRQSGNLPCVDRILGAHGTDRGIQTVYSGVLEPKAFVDNTIGRGKLEAAGIKCIEVPGFANEILAVATAGHQKK